MYPIDKLLNQMRAQAIAVISTYSQTRIGIIVGYNPDDYTAAVEIQPEGIKTGFLPILAPWIGNQYGFYAAPALNDMVIVHFQEGDFTSGLVGQCIYSLVDRPINPGPPSGEVWMVHKTGTYLKFMNDGTVAIKCLDEHNAKTNLTIDANIVVTGNISATGDILDKSATNTHTIANMRTIYNSHVHGGVLVGGANTQTTTQTQ